MLLESHWQDIDDHLKKMQDKLDNLMEILSDEDQESLEDLLDHYYHVGERNEADANNPDL